jgi:hypothetical protein
MLSVSSNLSRAELPRADVYGDIESLRRGVSGPLKKLAARHLQDLTAQRHHLVDFYRKLNESAATDQCLQGKNSHTTPGAACNQCQASAGDTAFE